MLLSFKVTTLLISQFTKHLFIHPKNMTKRSASWLGKDGRGIFAVISRWSTTSPWDEAYANQMNRNDLAFIWFDPIVWGGKVWRKVKNLKNVTVFCFTAPIVEQKNCDLIFVYIPEFPELPNSGSFPEFRKSICKLCYIPPFFRAFLLFICG